MRLGIEVLLQDDPVDLTGSRVGLLQNQASVDRRFRSSCDLFAERYPDELRALFAPQHGFWGEQQANMVESPHAKHERLGIPIHSLYSEVREPTAAMLSGLDLLVIDLQDVGTRVYTFVWTVLRCLRACAEHDVDVLILDRPNPLGGVQVEGAVLNPAYRSFVGEAAIPMRHALTLGELSRMLNQTLSLGAGLHVVSMDGWKRDQLFSEMQRAWVPPSPNLPTCASALVYPGQVLLEGTNLSEGRGTTMPFEVVGAPFIEADLLADELNGQSLPGIRFRPVRFRPTFDKWQGTLCGGVFLHVSDGRQLRPYATTLSLLSAIRRQWPDQFEWLPPPYEYETRKMPIDILSGDDRLRRWLNDEDELSADQVDLLSRAGLAAWQETARSWQDTRYAVDSPTITPPGLGERPGG
jgi:uncharacterized protein YbbC (DUF1343 family)